MKPKPHTITNNRGVGWRPNHTLILILGQHHFSTLARDLWNPCLRGDSTHPHPRTSTHPHIIQTLLPLSPCVSTLSLSLSLSLSLYCHLPFGSASCTCPPLCAFFLWCDEGMDKVCRSASHMTTHCLLWPRNCWCICPPRHAADWLAVGEALDRSACDAAPIAPPSPSPSLFTLLLHSNI
eukprot:GGOE01047020.1.p1 GENE.GGOE01047020.1~~GGOE01047020.1.p1  ORF type:complete len:180 (+),score=2.92 GGOE01047020.1:693-1232(+)